jgi:hypothetical protein
MSALCFVLARYGIARKFKPGRAVLLLLVIGLVSLGGYRSYMILMLLTFLLVFYFEGLFRTQYALVLVSGVVLGGALLVPLANKLPLGIQRTLSFLPLDVNPVARYDAERSTEWRVEMWKTAWPDMHKYFWRGKGLLVSAVDMELTNELVKQGLISSQEEAVLAGSYHNGPMTLLIPFGVWGAIGWLWFLAASIRALYHNYRYGDPSLRTANAFLLAAFWAKTILFFTVFGDFRTGFAEYLGLVGLSVALNHGICKPALAPKALARPISLRTRPVLAQAAS